MNVPEYHKVIRVTLGMLSGRYMKVYQGISKKAFKVAIQVVSTVLIFVFVSSALDMWRAKQLPKGALPAGVYTTLTGQTINFHPSNTGYARDQLVVVYFWATWCGPCKVTTPSIKQLAKHYPVVSIAMASGDDATLHRYATQANLTVPIINDDEQAISKAWGVGVTPTVLFIKNGQIHGYTMGASGYPGLLARAWWWAKG